MDAQQEGIVNTCFLTTRLPSWAGSRQNVVGSNLEGKPVPSAELSPGRPGVRLATALEDHVLAVNAIIDDLKTQVAEMQTSVATIQQEVEALKQAHAAP